MTLDDQSLGVGITGCLRELRRKDLFPATSLTYKWYLFIHTASSLCVDPCLCTDVLDLFIFWLVDIMQIQTKGPGKLGKGMTRTGIYCRLCTSMLNISLPLQKLNISPDMGHTPVVPGTVEAKAGKVKEPGSQGAAWSTHADPASENKTIKQFTGHCACSVICPMIMPTSPEASVFSCVWVTL